MYNGKYLNTASPVLPPADRSYRYGDGLFETMFYSHGQIRLWELHADRLWQSMKILGYSIPVLFTREYLHKQLTALIERNKIRNQARIRFSVTRGTGGLYDADNKLNWLAESWATDHENKLNENGLVLDIYPDSRKSIDLFSGLKSASFLPYVMAAEYASKNKLNDCFILNSEGTLADSTIANLFIRKGDRYSSPGPAQGAVNGIMRRYLIGQMRTAGFEVHEEVVTPEQLYAADEVFLTNAIRGIRRVGRCGDKVYEMGKADEIYRTFIQTIS